MSSGHNLRATIRQVLISAIDATAADALLAIAKRDVVLPAAPGFSVCEYVPGEHRLARVPIVAWRIVAGEALPIVPAGNCMIGCPDNIYIAGGDNVFENDWDAVEAAAAAKIKE
jgi:hypothetical protein